MKNALYGEWAGEGRIVTRLHIFLKRKKRGAGQPSRRVRKSGKKANCFFGTPQAGNRGGPFPCVKPESGKAARDASCSISAVKRRPVNPADCEKPWCPAGPWRSSAKPRPRRTGVVRVRAVEESAGEEEVLLGGLARVWAERNRLTSSGKALGGAARVRTGEGIFMTWAGSSGGCAARVLWRAFCSRKAVLDLTRPACVPWSEKGCPWGTVAVRPARTVELSVRPRPVGPESFLVWGTLPSEEQRPFRKEAAVRPCPPETRETAAKAATSTVRLYAR